MCSGSNRLPVFPNFPTANRARIEKFDRYERSLIAHVTAAAQDIARATVLQSAAHAAVRESERPANLGSTKAVKMKVPKFDGKEADSLVFWIREIEIALSAGQIYDHRSQVAFALSNLGVEPVPGQWPARQPTQVTLPRGQLWSRSSVLTSCC